MFGFFRPRSKPTADSPVPEVGAETAVIEACRKRFGTPPRSLVWGDAQACRLALTPEVDELFKRTNDPMLRILEHQEALRDRGRVVWAHLLQANQILFDPANTRTLPAIVVYSLDPYFDGRVGVLAKIAHGLYDQKGSVPRDRELREFVRVITDERERIMRRELPRGYCGGRSVYYADCFIQPGHLPGNCLRRPAFPLLVNFEETEAVMILPARFWPAEFVAQWGR
jgi:hypothetical protein